MCARIDCDRPAAATVRLSYDARLVLVQDLASERSPYLLDLCVDHLDRLTPPIGWSLRDERVPIAADLL
jgi:hypothetical protein